MNIRDAAINCEVRKIAYRQTKDGVVVSFVLHPNDVPAELANAHLGTRYMIALVEIGDDDQPKGGAANERLNNDTPRQQPDKPAGGARKWDELPYSQQAAMACNDPIFWAFLREHHAGEVRDSDAAAKAVRIKCWVTSRADIQRGIRSGDLWSDLWTGFINWKFADRVSA